MRYLKLYEQFRILLEKIERVDKIKTENKLFRSFGSKEKIVQCVEEVFVNQNLKYLGGGGVGLTFQMLESPELPDSFYDKNSFEGEKCNLEMKCIKMTLQEDEVESARQLLNKNLKGICGYYWIKSYLFEDKKVYFICMDFLKLLHVEEKMIAHLIFNLYYPKNYWSEDTNNKLSKVFNWIKEASKSLDNTEYTDSDFIENYKHGIRMANVQGLTIDSLIKMFCSKDGNENLKGQESLIRKKWFEMDENYFKSFATKLLEIYKIATSAGLTSAWHNNKGPDLQENNLGYRGNELVGFDLT